MEDNDEEAADLRRVQLEAVHQWLQSKVDGPQVRAADLEGTSDLSNATTQNYPFSDGHLRKMNISEDPSHSLKLRIGVASRRIETDALGADSLWSADMLYRHLQFLEGLVPQTASFDPSDMSSPHDCYFITKLQPVRGSMPCSIVLLLS